jgi:hypothetical protein
LKKYDLPFIDSQIGQLSKFDPEVRQALLHIRGRLSIINEQIDEARELFRLTYDSSLTRESRQAVMRNIENAYGQIGQQAKMLADLISKTLPLLHYFAFPFSSRERYLLRGQRRQAIHCGAI